MDVCSARSLVLKNENTNKKLLNFCISAFAVPIGLALYDLSSDDRCVYRSLIVGSPERDMPR